MATVYLRKLKSGPVWYVRAKIHNEWRSIRSGDQESKRAALNWGNWLEVETDAGRDPLGNPAGDRLMLPAAAEMFLKARQPFVAAKTLVAYKDTLALATRSVGTIVVAGFGKSELATFRRALAHMRPHSQNHYLAHLKAFLNWISKQPEFSGYRPPRIELVRAPGTAHRDYYTVPECRSLLLAAQGVTINRAPFDLFLELLLLTGMRLGEACAVRREWVAGDSIKLPSTVTKTNRSRTVPLNSRLAESLQSLPAVDGRLFPFSHISGYLREVWVGVTVKAEVRHLKIHNLRDTFIVHSILAGVPMRVIAAICGNSVLVIERNYSALSVEELASAMTRTQGFATSLRPTEPNRLELLSGETDS